MSKKGYPPSLRGRRPKQSRRIQRLLQGRRRRVEIAITVLLAFLYIQGGNPVIARERSDKKQEHIDKHNTKKQQRIDARNDKKQASVDAHTAKKQQHIDKRNAKKQERIDKRNTKKQKRLDKRNAKRRARAERNGVNLDYPKPVFDGQCAYVIDTTDKDMAGVPGKIRIENETDSLVPITVFVHNEATGQWENVFQSHIYERTRRGKNAKRSKDCAGSHARGKFVTSIKKYTGKEKYRYIALKFGIDDNSIISSDMKVRTMNRNTWCTITNYDENVLLCTKNRLGEKGDELLQKIYASSKYHGGTKMTIYENLLYDGKECLSYSWENPGPDYIDYGLYDENKFTRKWVTACRQMLAEKYPRLDAITVGEVIDVYDGLFFDCGTYGDQVKYYAYHNGKRLYTGSEEVLFKGEMRGDLYFVAGENILSTGGEGSSNSLYKNDTKLCENALGVRFVGQDLYYIKDNHDLCKNGLPIYSAAPGASLMGEYNVSNAGDAAYIQLNADGSSSVYFNGAVHHQTKVKERAYHLTLRPDGKRLYYYLADSYHGELVSVVGFDVSPNAAGWYDRYVDFIFSPDSRHAACALRSNDGYVIFLDNDAIFCKQLSRDLHFTDDSKCFAYYSADETSGELKETRLTLK